MVVLPEQEEQDGLLASLLTFTKVRCCPDDDHGRLQDPRMDELPSKLYILDDVWGTMVREEDGLGPGKRGF